MKTSISSPILGAIVSLVLIYLQCNLTPSIDVIESNNNPEIREGILGNIPLNDPETFVFNGFNSGLYP